MAIRKSPKTPPLHPDIQKWVTSTEHIKKALDKRKGEKGVKGIQEARESICKGAKIMMTLLNDASFPEKSLKEWEDWCSDEFSEHQAMIDQSLLAKMLFALFRALVAARLEPQFPAEEEDGSAPEEGTPQTDWAVVGRVLKAISATQPIILEGHEGGTADVKTGRSGKAQVQTPYVTMEWFEMLLAVLEYAEGKGQHHPQSTENIAYLFELLTGHDNTKACGVWGTDKRSAAARSRLGTLILDSETATMSFRGLRILIFSLPTVEEPDETLAESRNESFLAAIKRHPLWTKSSPELRASMKQFLASLPARVAMKPRVYMKMINSLPGDDSDIKPQGFPFEACSIHGQDITDNSKAKIRLAEGELIVYVDQLQMRINGFDRFGREDPSILDDIGGRMFNIWRGEDPNTNRFHFSLLARLPGVEDRDIIMEIESAYADKFEAALKRLTPTSAWFDHVRKTIGVQRPSAPDNDTGELVPESSALPHVDETEANESRVLDSVLGVGRYPSHASDSFGQSSAPKTRSGKSSGGAKAASSLAQEVKAAEEEGDGEAEEEVEQPRRGTRSSNAAESSSTGSKAPAKVPPKTTSKAAAKEPVKASAKSTSKTPAKKSKPAQASTGDRPPSPPADQPDAVPSGPAEPASKSSRPSRAAKIKSMQKTSGVISGEAVPLAKEDDKAASGVKKDAPVKEVDQADEVVGEGEAAVEEEAVLPQAAAAPKKAVTKGKGKAKAADAAVEDEGEEEDAAPELKKAVAKPKGKGKAARVDDEGEDGASASSYPIAKPATPVILVPASSLQVPITKANPVSRSRQNYSRDKPASTKKNADPEADSEAEVEEEEELQDNIIAIPLPTPASKKSSTSAKPTTAKADKPTASGATKSKAPAKVTLRSTKPKETIAGEIKSGRAMTPAAVQAKVAAAASAEKEKGSAEKGKKGKGVVAEKKGKGKGVEKKSMGPPKAVLEDKAHTAPGRMEDIEGDGASASNEVEAEVEEDVVPEEVEVKKKGTAGATRTAPARGRKTASPAEKAGGEDPAEKEEGEKSEKAKAIDAPAPTPVPASTRKKPAKAPKKASTPARPPPELDPEPIEADAVAEPNADDLAEDDPMVGLNPSPLKSALRQPSPEKITSSRSRQPARDSSPVRPVIAGKTVAFSDPVEPVGEERVPTPAPEDEGQAEEEVARPPVEEERLPSASPPPAAKPAKATSTSNAGTRRKADVPDADQPSAKRDVIDPPAQAADLKADIERPKASTPRVESRHQGRPEVVIPATSRRTRGAPAPVAEDAPVVPPVLVDANGTTITTNKRKVSINEPEVQVRKVRRVEGGDIGRGGSKGRCKSQAVEAVMNTIDEISEAVKRRIEERLAIPDKVIGAIERHVTKVATKSVEGFGVDHDSTYRSLSTHTSTIHKKQFDLQKLYRTHAATAKTQHRQACDLFKLHKRPMEGIPATLFE